MKAYDLIAQSAADSNYRLPQPVIYLDATAGDRQVGIKWLNPPDEDVAGIDIRYSTHDFPELPDEGTLLGRFASWPGFEDSCTHDGLNAGTTYYYSAFTFYSSNNYSMAVCDSATPHGPDVIPPILTLGVLQNPCLTRYLDVYLVASEILDPDSVELLVNGTAVAINLADPNNSVWKADYKLASSGGVAYLEGRGSDIAGNMATVTAEFSSAFLASELGGSVSSPDGKMTLMLPPDALARDAHITVLPCAARSAGSGGSLPQGAVDGLRVLAPMGESPVGYWVGPREVLGGNSATIEFKYAGSDLSPGCWLDQLCIHHEGVGLVECSIDPESKTVSAVVSELGVFSLAQGPRGTSTVADPGFLWVGASYPNPFNKAVNISFGIGVGQQVEVSVFDVRGKQIARLVGGTLAGGKYEVVWTGTSSDGSIVPSGVYFIRILTEHDVHTSKLVVLR
jgi:hypothetical protein